jgi:group I intron endonuclease
MAYLYLITNLSNNKKYIGATIVPVETRWYRHVRAALQESSSQTIHAAIRKYGQSNFRVEMLLEHRDTDFLFNVLEPIYIALYESHGTMGGYNMTFGGEGWKGMKHTQKTKDLISLKNTGKKRTPEQRAKLSLLRRGRKVWNTGQICPTISEAKKGKYHSEQSKTNMSASHLGFKHSSKTVDVMKSKASETHKLLNTNTHKIITITNLHQFCKNNNIQQSNLSYLGKCKNFKLLESTKKVQTYYIVDIYTHEQFVSKNLREFCKTHNISNSALLTKYKLNKSYRNFQILNIETEYVTVSHT